MMIYLDNAATTKPLDCSLEEFFKVERECYFNPSSTHSAGSMAAGRLAEYRQRIADAIGVDTDTYNVVFTSSASESNGIVMQYPLKLRKTGKVLFSKGEHKSVSANKTILKKYGIGVVEANARKGYVNPEELKGLIDSETQIVSIIHTNNITGAVNDIESLCSVAKDANPGLLFHSDITQSVGKGYLDFGLLKKIDAFSLSAHKLHAPKGLGLLVLKKTISPALSPAGGQEFGIRGGTQAVALAGAFCTAIEYIVKNHEEINDRISHLCFRFLEGLHDISGVKIFRDEQRMNSPCVVAFGLPSVPGEVSQRILSDEGFMVGTTAACSSNSAKSDVNTLAELGFDPQYAKNALRVSFSMYNTETEVDALLFAIKKMLVDFGHA